MADYKTSNSNNTIFNPLPSPLFTICFIIFLCILGIYIFHHPDSKTPKTLSNKNALYFQELFLSSSTNYTLSSYLRALTAHQHVAGTAPSLQTLHYVETHFRQDLGLPTVTVDFDALLSYPSHSSLTLHFKNGSYKNLSLTEPGQLGRVIDPYHAYSPSGSAHGKPVFANYGRVEDYRALEALGVYVKGCVVVVRRGGEVGRGEVVEVAAERGAVAVLTYAEGDRFSGGVERGTVMRGLGDPLTPGWAAAGDEGGGERLSVEDKEVKERFPAIPSMPISAENADVILLSLEGPSVPPEWRDTVSSGGGKVGRRVGAGPTLVNFTYQGEKKVMKIHDVFAVIRGWEEPDRYVLLGNHRDAWTYGAVDPNSGTAALLDIARRYSLLMRKGWAPRRTIVLCSWDAEEFGMVGSTEWVEQNLVNLGSKAVAYLNVDCAVQGPGLFASATPQLDDLIVDVTKKIKDPDFEDMYVYQSWTATNKGVNIQRLSRVDSDFAPFLQHAGVPSVDLYYGEDYPVYHTAFDSYDWMIKYGDPSFHRHVAVAGIWGLLALRLADDPIIPYNYLSYATQLQEHTNILGSLLDTSVSLHPIAKSIQELSSAARLAEEEAKKLREVADDNLLELKRRALNDRLMLAERAFTDADGLQGRQWFKHLIYGPPKEYNSKLSFFPGIADAISQATRVVMKEGQSAVQHEVFRVARAIQRAAIALRGELI